MSEKLEGYENVLKLVRKKEPPTEEHVVPINKVLTYFMHAAVIQKNPYACMAAYICLASQSEGYKVVVTPELKEVLDETNPDDLLTFMEAGDIYNQEF